jgi:predicted HTH domain antitoxin
MKDNERLLLIEALTKEYAMIDRRDLFSLVKVALTNEEITMSKASELLGLPLVEMRCIANYWVEEAGESK